MTAALPDRVPAPPPSSEKLTPAGRSPLLSLGAGKPLAPAIAVNARPAVSLTVVAVVKAGALSTISTNAWLVVPVPFLAVKVSGNDPAAVGVPDRVPVPFRLSVKVTPVGRPPARPSVGAGVPVVVTLKLKALPSVTVAAAALVMASPLFTVSRKLWLAVPDELAALMVSR